MAFLAKLSPQHFATLCLDFGSQTNLARFKEFAKNNAGKTVRIEIPKAVRSNTQNAYYWLYLGIIERETGNNADDLHEFFKRKFLPPRFIVVLGTEMRVPGSTAALDKVHFGEYLDKIAALTNVPLPNPEEAGYLPN